MKGQETTRARDAWWRQSAAHQHPPRGKDISPPVHSSFISLCEGSGSWWRSIRELVEPVLGHTWFSSCYYWCWPQWGRQMCTHRSQLMQNSWRELLPDEWWIPPFLKRTESEQSSVDSVTDRVVVIHELMSDLQSRPKCKLFLLAITARQGLGRREKETWVSWNMKTLSPGRFLWRSIPLPHSFIFSARARKTGSFQARFVFPAAGEYQPPVPGARIRSMYMHLYSQKKVKNCFQECNAPSASILTWWISGKEITTV